MCYPFHPLREILWGLKFGLNVLNEIFDHFSTFWYKMSEVPKAQMELSLEASDRIWFYVSRWPNDVIDQSLLQQGTSYIKTSNPWFCMKSLISHGVHIHRLHLWWPWKSEIGWKKRIMRCIIILIPVLGILRFQAYEIMPFCLICLHSGPDDAASTFKMPDRTVLRLWATDHILVRTRGFEPRHSRVSDGYSEPAELNAHDTLIQTWTIRVNWR